MATPHFFPQPMTATILLSVSVDVTHLDTSYNWNHAVFILL